MFETKSRVSASYRSVATSRAREKNLNNLTKRALQLQTIDGDNSNKLADEKSRATLDVKSVFSNASKANQSQVSGSINSVYMKRRIAAAKKGGFPELEMQQNVAPPGATNA